ncbi:MAG: 50S ribosomal protein L11 methyltransferase [Alphaproteobacteria bacterium]|nr:50S ribosomal protein L11 methyltransferase [Alphaproteobacteria bacterium]
MTQDNLHTIRLNIKTDYSDEDIMLLAEGLADEALSSAAQRQDRKHTKPWTLEWIFPEKPEAKELIAKLALQVAVHNLPDPNVKPEDFLIEKTPDINWLEKSYQEFPPFSIGPFFIHGSHYQGNIPPQQIELKIDAATAFGSGEHETTKGCIQAMLDLKGKGLCPWNVLDMGTGSGILALAAWKLWKTPILAVDIEEESVIVTKRHAQMNGVKLGGSTLTAICGDGFNTPEVSQKKPYELILANILAGPVIEMSGDLVAVMDDNSYCILSGMLVEQADLVASAYEGEGLTLKKKYDIGEWSTLVMHKA